MSTSTELTDAQAEAAARVLLAEFDPSWPYYEYDEMPLGRPALLAVVRKAFAATEAQS